jgi:hypothetical protein
LCRNEVITIKYTDLITTTITVATTTTTTMMTTTTRYCLSGVITGHKGI